MDKTKHNNSNGAITVEAVISLTAFMFVILNICIVQSRIAVAINSTAKELSQYSYLLSLTGIQDSITQTAEAASEKKEKINGTISDVNTVFSAIQNLGTGKDFDTEDISGSVQKISDDVSNIKDTSTDLYETFKSVATDPKAAIMGIAQIAMVDGYNLMMSRLIAAPLAKGLCKKNLKGSKNGDADSYLKSLGVVPNGAGKYYDALDFSESTIFPNGSNEIRVVVEYNVKVAALLPIDFSFHFKQSAVTLGWMGDSVLSEISKDTSKNEKKAPDGNLFNVWIHATVQERADLIRHMEITELCDAGGERVTGGSYQHIQVYNKSENMFYSVHSMNPLYSAEDEDPKTLDDVSADAIQRSIEQMCGSLKKEVSATDKIQTKGADGQKKDPQDCKEAKATVVLVIPEDEGLKEHIQGIINKSDTKGVTIQLVTGYGNGARDNNSTGGNE